MVHRMCAVLPLTQVVPGRCDHDVQLEGSSADRDGFGRRVGDVCGGVPLAAARLRN
jgi:hypothetical protein